MSVEEDIALATAALTAIEQIVAFVRGAKDGTIDPTAVLNALEAFSTSLTKNNAAADQALDSRFPK